MPQRVIAGKTVLITGGAQGIGRATAQALLAEGLKVAIADIDLGLAERTARELSEHGTIRAYALDVRDARGFDEVVAQVDRDLAPLDILINNAGIMPIGGFLDLDPTIDDRQIDINLRGVIHGMRAALPGMLRRRRGHIVNISSTAGKVGVPFISVYAATKHAVVGLTEAVRNEMIDSGVDFSFVMPAIVNTELTSGTRSLRYPPPVEPSDVADAVVNALCTGKVDVYVPRFAKLAVILPVLLPRRAVEQVGRFFGVDRVFERVDEGARAAYRDRIVL